MTRIGCVVLAAGFSNRLGEEKALLETGDGALVGWITKRLSNQGIHPVVVTRGDILDEVEKKFNTTVISSNQAIIWDCLQLLNINIEVQGYGKLFNSL